MESCAMRQKLNVDEKTYTAVLYVVPLNKNCSRKCFVVY